MPHLPASSVPSAENAMVSVRSDVTALPARKIFAMTVKRR
jgi:hypothetical protein